MKRPKNLYVAERTDKPFAGEAMADGDGLIIETTHKRAKDRANSTADEDGKPHRFLHSFEVIQYGRIG